MSTMLLGTALVAGLTASAGATSSSKDALQAEVHAAEQALANAEATLLAARARAARASGSSVASMPKPKPLTEPLLFMDLQDVQDPWGLMWAEASTLAPDEKYRPPPLPYDSGATVVSVLPARDFSVSGEYEVYASNTTGWEPLAEPESDSGEPAESEPQLERVRGGPKYPECGRESTCPVSLLRYTTKDFLHYSPPHLSLHIPDDPIMSGGTPTVKSIARNDDTGLYVLFACYMGSCSHTFTSTTEGMDWTLCNITGVVSPDKDDLNLIFNQGQFVDMQIVWQTWAMKYCDNGGCNRRRVISAKTSENGADWSEDLGLHTPDSLIRRSCSSIGFARSTSATRLALRLMCCSTPRLQVRLSSVSSTVASRACAKTTSHRKVKARSATAHTCMRSGGWGLPAAGRWILQAGAAHTATLTPRRTTHSSWPLQCHSTTACCGLGALAPPTACPAIALQESTRRQMASSTPSLSVRKKRYFLPIFLKSGHFTKTGSRQTYM